MTSERRKNKMATVKEHPFDREVSERISNYCRDNDISLRKLAKEAGLTNNQIYFITTHRSTISLDHYVRICKALKEPVDYFLKEV